ncbi:uncharacterized protein I206_104728 [Kwoniella pini CBS 10737]|uniref:Uncharacterized protein n=1 Tax=Kwoniella pini CBS 10737 TaxID=1296096 RepID=A0A1B9I7K9_9TREE|nr:uncharacterized protein I206_02266 [Kwoniella pini CBS 10737]OCF51552.1 hypothetical protein I206_02266 [Kwoniella pini CBS 10737]
MQDQTLRLRGGGCFGWLGRRRRNKVTQKPIPPSPSLRSTTSLAPDLTTKPAYVNSATTKRDVTDSSTGTYNGNPAMIPIIIGPPDVGNAGHHGAHGHGSDIGAGATSSSGLGGHGGHHSAGASACGGGSSGGGGGTSGCGGGSSGGGGGGGGCGGGGGGGGGGD